MELDRVSAACTAYELALVQQPTDFNHLMRLGVAHEKAKNWTEMQSVFAAGAQIDPTNVQTILGLSTAQLKLGRKDLAQKSLDEAASRGVKHPHIDQQRGKIEQVEKTDP